MHVTSPRLAAAALAAICMLVACADDGPTTTAADALSADEAELHTVGNHLRGSVRLRARLSGAEEVPPADDDGDGNAVVRVAVEQGEVCFDVRFDDITTGNRAHIHRAPAGVNGGIVVAFFDLQTAASQRDPRLDVLEERERLSGCITGLDPALLAEIVANPSEFYVNVHNSRFPGGAVRAQLHR